MLTRISIQNYAIIDELEIPFSPNLNVITGETGAGKSILAGALGLILGDRADSGVLVNKERKCVVEGYFSQVNEGIVFRFLQENELDHNDELVIRREIAVNGKSRAFVNDTPVTLSQLQELGGALVDLHRQFDTQSVGESDFQRDVIDALAGHGKQLTDYRERFLYWQKIHQELVSQKEQQAQLEKEADFNRFLFNELEDAAFRENELEELEAELKMSSQAEGIRAALDRISQALTESESPIVNQLKVITGQADNFGETVPGLGELLERLRSCQVELQDISSEILRMSDRISLDPARVEEISDRLSTGYKLQKKHGLHSTAELISLRNELEAKLGAVTDLEDAISQKEEAAKKALAELQTLAQQISEGRKKQLKPLEEKVNKLLGLVGMPNARLRVKMETTGLNERGADSILFLFNANLPTGQKAGDEAFQPLKKVASGGELSRLMLCIKSLVAASMDLPTMIFDEIDSGISGEAARQVGLIMKELAATRQVVTITHQPQIAGKGDRHFFVYKEIVNERVVTRVRMLEPGERVEAIARMLSGEQPTDAALQNARELLG